MTHKPALFAVWLLVWLYSATSQADIDPAALSYQVTYRGVFSLGRDLPIADMTIAEQSLGDALHASELAVTSAAYPNIESMYPIRYRFRSWTTSTGGDLVGFETYQKTSKLRHRLYVRDAAESGVKRLSVKAEDGQQALARLDAGKWSMQPHPGETLFDRLSLLQGVRDFDLAMGREFELPVTNGKERLRYHVKVERAQDVSVAGQMVAAWKVRFDGFERNDRGELEAAHRPIYIWFSQTPEHIPLRADNRHAIGLFRIELTQLPPGNQVAQRGR